MSVYMLAGDMDLHIGEAQWYNNDILIAQASIGPGTQIDVNEKLHR